MEHSPRGAAVHIHPLDFEGVPEKILDAMGVTGFSPRGETRGAAGAAWDTRGLRFLRETVAKVLEHEGKPVSCDVSIVLASKKAIREMNARYLDRRSDTDVLCFPYSAKPPYRADIIVSVEKAQEQCATYSNTLKQEIATLVIHGMLHLLGYGDGDAASRERMNGKQKRILGELKLD